MQRELALYVEAKARATISLAARAVAVLAFVFALTLSWQQIALAVPDEPCTTYKHGLVRYAEGEGYYRCNCNVDGCNWVLLKSDPLVHLDDYIIQFGASVPSRHLCTTKRIEYDLFIPSNVEVRVVELQSAVEEKVTVHRTRPRAPGDALQMTVVTTVRARETFEFSVEVTRAGILPPVIETGFSNQRVEVKIELP